MIGPIKTPIALKYKSNTWTAVSLIDNKKESAVGSHTKVLVVGHLLARAALEEKPKHKSPGRPAKDHLDLHCCVPRETKHRLQGIAEKYNISIGEAVILAVNAFDFAEADFVNVAEMFGIKE